MYGSLWGACLSSDTRFLCHMDPYTMKQAQPLTRRLPGRTLAPSLEARKKNEKRSTPSDAQTQATQVATATARLPPYSSPPPASWSSPILPLDDAWRSAPASEPTCPQRRKTSSRHRCNDLVFLQHHRQLLTLQWVFEQTVTGFLASEGCKG